jgi:hypothetical protein
MSSIFPKKYSGNPNISKPKYKSEEEQNEVFFELK